MDCWAHINGKDYPIANGFTITDEFSETLDSASIILPHVAGSLSIKPYDDVIIHDFAPDSEGNSQLPPRPLNTIIKTDDSTSEFYGHFYRHMLIYNYDSEQVMVNLSADADGIAYHNYTIELVSETKGLETIQLPNKTITQPIGTGESNNEPTYASANFSFLSNSILTKSTLPLSIVDNYKNGILTGSYIEERYIYKSYLFISDMDESTTDYSIFTQVLESVEPSSKMLLPDWACNGVTQVVAESLTLGLFYSIVNQTTYHPTKHWVVVKSGVNDNSWSTREKCISRIHSYLDEDEDPDGLNYADIVNSAIYDGQRDITDSRPSSNIVVTMPSLTAGSTSDGYTIYLYVENQNGKTSYFDLGDVNVFGMTDNSAGTTAPTAIDEFLVSWSIRVEDSSSPVGKGVLSVYEAIRQVVELYSPYIKVTTDGTSWSYRRKYSIGDSLAFFRNVIAPENQWNYPNLRDVLTRLMQTSDCIPVVHDGVIGCINLSQRYEDDFDTSKGRLSYIHRTMDGSSYCDRLLRNYSDGLSKDNVTKCVERIGFKNSSSPLLTLENLRLELMHPIYSIEKVYMCYYNGYRTGSQSEESSDSYMKLCKQDITPLVLLNAQRNLLSEDWNSLNDFVQKPTNIYGLAKFKYATIGYDIGSRYITGFGDKYEFPTNIFWTSTKTVIENIFDFCKTASPVGIDDGDFESSEVYNGAEFSSNASETREVIVDDPEDTQYDGHSISLINTGSVGQREAYYNFFGNYTQRLKSLVFIIEYNGYVSTAVNSSKDIHDGPVVSRDNASSSLSFVESDGINQKEKVNRLGNETIMASGRYASLDDIQPIACAWNDSSNGHIDEVLYRRQISFFKDYFSVSYYFCKNYALRNYFTSVFSRHRPFALASYEESVERQENKTLEVLLSPDKAYWQDDSNVVEFSYDVDKLISFFKSSDYDNEGNLVVNEGIDFAYYCVYPSAYNLYTGQSGIFASDLQKFVSGNSICFVVSMHDNVSAGVFVSDFNHNLGYYVGNIISNTFELATNWWKMSTHEARASNLLTGAKQDWLMFPVDPSTGMLYSASFGIGYKTNDVYGVDSLASMNPYDISVAQMLPLVDSVLQKSEGDKIYFGQEKDGSLVGAGYPRIMFSKNSYGNYRASMDNAGGYFLMSDCVHTVTDQTTFATYDGESLSSRMEIQEFARAKFKGAEIENAEETDTCVFKDGKERIISTIQFEPISEDERISLSENMMRLSDVMGGFEKNYYDFTVSQAKRMRFYWGASNIAVGARETVGTDVLAFSALLTIPTLSIAVPAGSLSVVPQSQPIPIAKEFTLHGDSDYTLYMYSIISAGTMSIDGTSVNYIVAKCDITFRGETLYDQEITFYKLSQISYIKGRTEGSTFSVARTCFKAPAQYDTYAYCEDGFFLAYETPYEESPIISFSYKEKTFTDNGLIYPNITVNNRTAESSLIKVLAYPDKVFPYSDSSMSWDEYDYKNTYVDYVTSGEPAITPTLQASATSYFEYGQTMGEDVEKTRNLYWCLSSRLMDKNTQYEKLTNLGDMRIFSGEHGTAGVYAMNEDNISIEQDELLGGHGPWHMDILLPYDTLDESQHTTYDDAFLPLTGYGSLRLYYLEDNVYKFVFGVNIDVWKEESERRSDCLYPVDSHGWYEYRIYLSFLDSRSKSVYDNFSNSSSQGDAIFKIKDFSDNETAVGNYIEEESD